MDVPCNQWVDLYLDRNGNLQGCYASVNGCYDPGTMTVDPNSVQIDFGIIGSRNITQQQQQDQPPTLLRGRKLALN